MADNDNKTAGSINTGGLHELGDLTNEAREQGKQSLGKSAFSYDQTRVVNGSIYNLHQNNLPANHGTLGALRPFQMTPNGRVGPTLPPVLADIKTVNNESNQSLNQILGQTQQLETPVISGSHAAANTFNASFASIGNGGGGNGSWGGNAAAGAVGGGPGGANSSFGAMLLALTNINNTLSEIKSILENLSGISGKGGAGGGLGHIKNHASGSTMNANPLGAILPMIIAGIGAFLGPVLSGIAGATGKGLSDYAKGETRQIPNDEAQNSVDRQAYDKVNGSPDAQTRISRTLQDAQISGRRLGANQSSSFGKMLQGGAYGAFGIDEIRHGFGAFQDFAHGDTAGGINELGHMGTSAGQFLPLARLKSGPGSAIAGAFEGVSYLNDKALLDKRLAAGQMTQQQHDEAMHDRQVRGGITLGEIGGYALTGLAKSHVLKGGIAGAALGVGEIGYAQYQINKIQNDPHLDATQKNKAIADLHRSQINTAGGTIGGILGGAALGAAVGSVVPVVGTAIGGVVGGVAGYYGGEKLTSTIQDHWGDIKKGFGDFTHGLTDPNSSQGRGALAASATMGPMGPGIVSMIQGMTQMMHQGQNSASNVSKQFTIHITNPVVKDLASIQDIEKRLKDMVDKILADEYNDQKHSNIGLVMPTIPGFQF